MLRRTNFLPFLVLAALAAVWSGCSQPEDVVTPITSTSLTLAAERLPTTPSGMIYELWVAGASDTVSLGKFFYSADSAKYYVPGGGSSWVERSNTFAFDDDLLKYQMNGSVKSFKYSSVFVSVETYPTDDAAHGPIMLIDAVTDPNNDPLELVFPLSDTLWLATARMNMESTSDRNLTNDGRGVWFSIYRAVDITRVDSLSLDTASSQVSIPIDERDSSHTYICRIYNIRVESSLVAFGLDTLYYDADTVRKIAVRYDQDVCYPASPWTKPSYVFTYQLAPEDTLSINLFSQDNFNLPNYSEFGWKYKGWVVSDQIPNTAMGAFTPPAWVYKGTSFNYIPGDGGGLFTTGTFSRIDTTDDDGNPYGYPKPASSLYDVTPLFPGGDFINSTTMNARFGTGPVDLLGGPGTAFISMEPANNPDTNTNFPLIVMLRSLPYDNPGSAMGSTVQLNMFNKSSHIGGDLQGFPTISIQLDRH
jgi:hypothetical protein